MSETAIETHSYRTPDGRTYRIEIFQDTDAESPRDTEGNLTVLTTVRGEYRSPDRESDPTEYIPSDYITPSGKIDGRYAARYLNLFGRKESDIVEWAFLRREPRDGTLTAYFRSACDTDDVYDGLVILTESALKEGYPQAIGDSGLMQELIDSEVNVYNTWARGEYVGYVVSRVEQCNKSRAHVEILDSCWGFDSIECALEGAMWTLPDGVEEYEEEM